MPLNEMNVYEQDERGLSSACTLQGIGASCWMDNLVTMGGSDDQAVIQKLSQA